MNSHEDQIQNIMMQLQNQVQISENIQENVGTDVDSRFNILDERLQ
jgi:hypothetical protein